MATNEGRGAGGGGGEEQHCPEEQGDGQHGAGEVEGFGSQGCNRRDCGGTVVGQHAVRGMRWVARRRRTVVVMVRGEILAPDRVPREDQVRDEHAPGDGDAPGVSTTGGGKANDPHLPLDSGRSRRRLVS